MPRTPGPKTPPRKPYLPRVSESSATPPQRSNSPEVKTAHGPPSPKSAQGAGSRRWTNDEYLDLFHHVVGHSVSFEGAVAGRTRNQAYKAWRCVVLPFIENALANKDGGTAAAAVSPSKTPKMASRKRRKVSDNDSKEESGDSVKVHIVPVVKNDMELD